MTDKELLEHRSKLLNQQNILITFMSLLLVIVSLLWSFAYNKLNNKYKQLLYEHNNCININKYIISDDINSITIKYRRDGKQNEEN